MAGAGTEALSERCDLWWRIGARLRHFILCDGEVLIERIQLVGKCRPRVKRAEAGCSDCKQRDPQLTHFSSAVMTVSRVPVPALLIESRVTSSVVPGLSTPNMAVRNPSGICPLARSAGVI